MTSRLGGLGGPAEEALFRLRGKGEVGEQMRVGERGRQRKERQWLRLGDYTAWSPGGRGSGLGPKHGGPAGTPRHVLHPEGPRWLQQEDVVRDVAKEDSTGRSLSLDWQQQQGQAGQSLPAGTRPCARGRDDLSLGVPPLGRLDHWPSGGSTSLHGSLALLTPLQPCGWGQEPSNLSTED